MQSRPCEWDFLHSAYHAKALKSSVHRALASWHTLGWPHLISVLHGHPWLVATLLGAAALSTLDAKAWHLSQAFSCQVGEDLES